MYRARSSKKRDFPLHTFSLICKAERRTCKVQYYPLAMVPGRRSSIFFSLRLNNFALAAAILIGCSCPTLQFVTAWSIRRHAIKKMSRRVSMTLNDESGTGSSPPPVIIAGAGIVGCSTAYYLAKDFGIASIIVDPSGKIAPAASGKAGGFLAKDWNDYSPVGPLARRSFDLHQILADTFGPNKMDYRRLTCVAIETKDNSVPVDRKPSGKKLHGVEWATGDTVQGVRSLGDESTIAQVHPLKLCQALWEETMKLAPDSMLVHGKVVGPQYNDDDDVPSLGVEVLQSSDNGTKETKVISGQALLYACGPWTANVMTGIKYHSVVMPTSTELSQCVFFSGFGDPEVYVRPDKTAYCTGFPDAPIQVKEEPGQEVVRDEVIAKIEQAVKFASNLEATESKNTPTVYQACYLPSTPDGLPIMGSLPDQKGCFVAAGHSCWGILMGPATGEAMAHLMVTGKSPKVSLSAFEPSRVSDLRMLPLKSQA